MAGPDMTTPIGCLRTAGRPTPRFRTIQVYPKDLRALPGHPEPAVSWHSGFRRGAHARPKTTRVHHASRRGGDVAACGAGAAGGADTAGRRSDGIRATTRSL